MTPRQPLANRFGTPQRFIVLCWLMISVTWIARVEAAEETFSSAGSANAFLDIGVGARAVALGEAYTALSQDVSSIYWNPAGLCRVSQFQFMLMHNQWFQDITYEYGAAALPVAGGTAGISAAFMQYGTMEKIDEFGQAQGNFSAYDLFMTGAYGMAFSDYVSAGAAVKVPLSMIDGQSSVSVAVDAGVQGSLAGWPEMRFGLVALNLGTEVAGHAQPARIKFGAGYFGPVPGLILAVDVSRRVYENVYEFGLGAEYKIAGLLTPRLGYRVSTEESGLGSGLSGLSAGLGVHYPFEALALDLDYAFVPYGDLGGTHRLALTLAWGSSTPLRVLPPRATAFSSPKQPASEFTAFTPSEKPVASAVPATPTLEPVTAVRATKLSAYSIRLTWKDRPDYQVQGYRIYMKKDRGAYEPLNRKPVKIKTFTAGKLERRHRYTFIIKTVDKSGQEGASSAPVALRLK